MRSNFQLVFCLMILVIPRLNSALQFDLQQLTTTGDVPGTVGSFLSDWTLDSANLLQSRSFHTSTSTAILAACALWRCWSEPWISLWPMHPMYKGCESLWQHYPLWPLRTLESCISVSKAEYNRLVAAGKSSMWLCPTSLSAELPLQSTIPEKYKLCFWHLHLLPGQRVEFVTLYLSWTTSSFSHLSEL